jgi:hypothetical protein
VTIAHLSGKVAAMQWRPAVAMRFSGDVRKLFGDISVLKR